jgi:hypothetical protein
MNFWRMLVMGLCLGAVARWRTLSGTCYVWLQSASVAELPVRGHSHFPRPLPVPIQQENGQDCRTASQTSRVSRLRRSSDFSGIGPESFWPTRDHCRSIGGWQSLVDVCGRPSPTSELEIRAAHP